MFHRPPIGLRTYTSQALPEWFPARHDGIQLAAIRKITQAVMVGGLHAVAMDPGDGKTTLAMAAAMWVTFEGLRKFPLLLMPTADRVEIAQTSITRAKTLETHGRERPFYSDQVGLIFDDIASRARPSPGISRRGHSSGSVLTVERPDLLIIDDPDDPSLNDEQREAIDDVLLAKIPGMIASGIMPAAILLGSPAVVAKACGGNCWQN